MANILTANAIVALNSGDVDLRPVLQVMDIRQIGNAQSTQERFRLVLSDGLHLQQAMLATQLNEKVKNNQAVKGSIVQLLEYICNTVQNRKIIIVLNMDIIASNAEIVGDPKPLGAGGEHQAVGAGPGTLPQQQQPPRLPAASPAQTPSISSYNNGGSRSGGGGLGQSLNGGGMDNGAAGFSMGQPTGGGYNPYASAGATVKTEPGGFQKSSFSGVGGGYSPQAQQQGGNGRTMAPYQPAPVYGNRGPIVKNEAPARIVPITALNPYQGRWTIKARVTSKSEIKRFHNAKGDGKVFSFDMLDADGGEIRATCFNSVVDQFFDRIEVGRVYLVTKGSLKAAQKKFNHLKNDWEITLESSSTIEPCFEEDNSIPQQVFDFKPISEIEDMETNATIDVIGIIVSINPSTTIMRKNGIETQKRTLQMKDKSGRSVEITMWGGFCNKEGQQLQELCDSGENPVLAVKLGRVSDFSGKSVGTISSTQLLINPDIQAAHQVRQWFDQDGKHSAAVSISREGGTGTRMELRKTVAAIKDEGLGRGDKPDWIAIRATIFYIKPESFCYPACPLEVNGKQCMKKVTNNGDGTWRCDRCDRSVQECDYRYLMSIQVQDHTGPTWITVFQDVGQDLTGHSAKELFTWSQDEPQKFSEAIQRLTFTKYVFKLKVKEEVYNDEQRTKSIVVKADPIDWVSENKLMIDWIGKLSRGEAISAPSVSILNGGGAYPTPTPGYGGATCGMGSNIGPNPGYGIATGGGYGGAYGGTGNGGSYGGTGGGGSYGGGTGGDGYGGGIGGGMGGSSGQCYKCKQDGHFARDCPEAGAGRGGSTYGGASGFAGGGGGGGGGGGVASSNCYQCGQGGHFARECPNKKDNGGGGGGMYGGRSSSGGGYGGGGGGGYEGRSGGYGGGY